VSTFESVDGVSLWYADHGSGEPVLLLHGVMSDSEFNWVRPGIVDALVDAGRRVLLLDARGHGRSGKPHEVSAYADDAMARNAQALLDELGIDVVDVVGYSMGAYTTSRLALRDGRPRKPVLGGAGVYTFRRNPEVAERFAQALETDDPTPSDDAAARAWRAYADATGVDRIAMACFFRTPWRSTDGELASLGSRTLILTGNARERTTRTTTARSTTRTSRKSCLRFSALREPKGLEEDVARSGRVAAIEEVLTPAVENEAEPTRRTSTRKPVHAAAATRNPFGRTALDRRARRRREFFGARVDLRHNLLPERLVEGAWKRREAHGHERVAVAGLHEPHAVAHPPIRVRPEAESFAGNLFCGNGTA
jgi:pimeloyl-ACP methyl ester carboxylesterase